jgi:purine-nucleoside phosphorylase
MKPKPIQTLFLAAHASELKPLVDLGRKHLLLEGETAFLAAGVGPVAATFGLTHFLEDYRPKQIIAVGTAGVINEKNFKIGDVVVAKSAGTASGFASVYTPKLQPQKIVISVGAGFKAARIYSPQEITRDENWQGLLSKRYDVEHLESFAFALVAKKFRIPIRIFLGLTNVIGPQAHAQWLKNREVLIKKTCLAIKKSY